MQREQFEAAVVDVYVQLVDIGVAAQHRIDQSLFALDQAADGEPEAVFGQSAHFEQPSLEFVEFVLKVSNVAFHDDVSPAGPSRTAR
jgi:hypothetical protein